MDPLFVKSSFFIRPPFHTQMCFIEIEKILSIKIVVGKKKKNQ